MADAGNSGFFELVKEVKRNFPPTQVQNVKVYHGNNRATSVEVHWSKVDERENAEEVRYDIFLARNNGEHETSVSVFSPPYIFKNLKAHTSYQVTVRARNKHGAGRYSEIASLTTEVETPKNVKLTPDPKMPTSQLVLSFSKAEGKDLQYLVALFKYQNETEIEVEREKTVPESPFVFGNLLGNTEYLAKVWAKENGNTIGALVSSNKMTTAPNQPVVKEIIRLSSQNIMVEWTSGPGCHSHEVSISCKDQIEARLVVYKEQLRYSCLEDGVRYCVQIQSKNSSGFFGEVSQQKYVDIEPRELKNASAKLEGNNIRVTCHKPKNRYTCLMNVFCGKEKIAESLLGQVKEDIMRQCQEKATYEQRQEVLEWIYTPDKNACEYTFEIWAISTANIEGKRSAISPITSRPMKVGLVNVKHGASSPSTDIEIAWEKQPRCNSYEIQVLKQEKRILEAVWKVSDKNTVLYKCLCPGDTYFVSVRAICQSTHGEWSEEQTITLAPVEVEFKESSKFIETEIPVVESIFIEWKSLEITPKHYCLQLYCNGEQVGEPVLKPPEGEMEHTFDLDLIKPGSLCYSTIEAFNGGKYGKQTKSKMCRIEWASPEFFTVQHDDNDPTTKAVVKWSPTAGVSFRLTIEHHQTGDLRSRDLPRTDRKYRFNSALPGNTYTMKLYWGCDGKYSEHFAEDTITMKPNPPVNVKVFANSSVRGLSIDNFHSEIANATYEICAWSEMHPTFKHMESISNDETWTLQNLIPGAKYEISMTTVVDDMRSEAALSTCFTYPQKIENLHAIYMNGKIKFEWNQPELKPDKYVVEWVVNNGQVKVDSTDKTLFTIDPREADDVYSLRVAASNPSGCGEMTTWENYIAAPQPPNNITVKPFRGSSGLIINYKDDASAVKKYEIILESQRNPEVVIQDITEKHFLTKSNLVPGDAYKVLVRTVIGNLKSRPAVSDGYTATFPGKVQDLRSIFRDGSIVFDWDPPQIKPDQYIVQRKVDNGAVVEETLEEPPFIIYYTKLARVYAVRVMSLNEAGRGPMSAWETITTVPEKVKNLHALFANGKIMFVWDESDVKPDKYIVEWKVDNGTVQKESTEMTSFTIDHIDAGGTYSLRVAASNRSGCGEMTLWLNCIPQNVPGKGEGPRPMITDGSMPRFDQGFVQTKPDQYFQWKSGYGSDLKGSAEDSALQMLPYGQTQVYAVRDIGMIKGPDPPQDIRVKPSKARSGLVINYKDDTSPRKMYEITLESQENPEITIQKITPHQCITVQNLTPGDAYRVIVRTIIDDVKSKPAMSDNYVVTFPGKVEGLRYTLANGNIVFDWDCPQIKPDQYIVEWKIENGQGIKDHLEEPPFTIYRCKPEQLYAVRVMASNEAGIGPMTSWKTCTTDTEKLEGTMAELKGDNIRVTCRKPNHSKYQCFMDVFLNKKEVTEESLLGKVKDDVVEWIYTPERNASEYTFKLRAKIKKEVEGEEAVLGPIISRPKKAKLLDVTHVNSSPSTDIEVSWKQQPRCDSYEVQIFVVGAKAIEKFPNVSGKTSLVYECLSPGNTYSVSVRAICQSTYGPWSEEQMITLAPTEVQFKEGSSEDVEVTKSIHVEWNPLIITPEYYRLQLYCDGEQVGEPVKKLPTGKMQLTFEKDLKPGSLYYCTIEAFNGGQYGELTKSKTFKIDDDISAASPSFQEPTASSPTQTLDTLGSWDSISHPTRSFSTSKMIGPEGGVIELLGCRIEFPPKIFKTPTLVKITIRSVYDDAPDGCIIISPELECTTRFNFTNGVATISLPIHAVPSDGKVKVMTKQDQNSDWEVMNVNPIVEERRASFQVSHFTVFKFFARYIPQFNTYLCHNVYFNSSKAQLLGVTCIDDKAEKKRCRESVQKKGFIDALTILDKKVQLCWDDVMSYRFKCEDPRESVVQPIADTILTRQDFKTNTSAGKHFMLLPRPSNDKNVVAIRYTLSTPDKEMDEDLIALEWKHAQIHEEAQATDPVTNVDVETSTMQFYNSHVRSPDVYAINTDQLKGKVLIINNKFLGKDNERHGSLVDVENLENLWRQIGFNVLTKRNLKGQDMLCSCREFAQNSVDINVLVLIIMSHGGIRDGEEVVCGEDNQTVSTEEIISYFTSNNAPHLQGIPKVLMFQACRGEDLDQNVEELPHDVDTRPDRYPERSDMLIVYPSQAGYASFRHRERGSWLMNAVTTIFMRNAKDTHVLDMLTKVNDVISLKESGGHGQMSNQLTYLRKKLFLFPGWPN